MRRVSLCVLLVIAGAACAVPKTPAIDTPGAETTYSPEPVVSVAPSTTPARPRAVAPKPSPSPSPTVRKTTAPKPNCHPSYRGACLNPNASDYDCAGGSGDGPYYVDGPIQVVGPDEYRLDHDKDGIGCE